MGDDACLVVTRDEFAGLSVLVYDDGLGGPPREIAHKPVECHEQFFQWIAQGLAAHHEIPLHVHPEPGP